MFLLGRLFKMKRVCYYCKNKSDRFPLAEIIVDYTYLKGFLTVNTDKGTFSTDVPKATAESIEEGNNIVLDDCIRGMVEDAYMDKNN